MSTSLPHYSASPSERFGGSLRTKSTSSASASELCGVWRERELRLEYGCGKIEKNMCNSNANCATINIIYQNLPENTPV